jgi:hypothetical protein
VVSTFWPSTMGDSQLMSEERNQGGTRLGHHCRGGQVGRATQGCKILPISVLIVNS